MKLTYWIKTRKFVIAFLSLDIISLLLICSTFQKESLSLISAFYFFIIWIFFSYILSRYSFKKKNLNSLFFVNDLFKLILTAFFSLLSLFIVNTFLLKFGFLYIRNLYLLEFILKQSFLSYFLIFSLREILKKVKNIKKNYCFIGSEEDFIKLKNICKQTSQDNLKDITFFKKVGDISNFDIVVSKIGELDIFLKDPYLRSKLFQNKKNIFTLTDWIEINLQRIPPECISLNKEYLNPTIYGLSEFNLKVKRLMDIIISLIIIIFTLPLILIISLLIYLEDFGPIIYYQKRNGFRGEIINIPKFRSMKVNAEKTGAVWSSKNDPRVTKVGKFIRAFRIDELPQLILVITGQMSLIGPRPERPEIDNFLTKEILFYSLRYSVLPGLSGWSQVCYRYGSSLEDSKIKISYDFFYIKNYSLALDLLIFFKTLKVILGAQK